jgi:plastocyanin
VFVNSQRFNSTGIVNSFTLSRTPNAGQTTHKKFHTEYWRLSEMRFSKLVVAASVIALAACGKTDETQTTTQTPAAPPPTPAATGVPITGETKVVQMVGDANGARFEPASVTLKPGDGIRFEVVSLPPHNVAFDAATLPEAAKAVFKTNMPEQTMGELAGKLLNNVGETYTLSFANVPPGTYEIICQPHLAMNMKMKVTVQ